MCRKVSDFFFFFLQTWWISMKHTLMRWPWTFICMREFFSCLSIASVDGKQHCTRGVRTTGSITKEYYRDVFRHLHGAVQCKGLKLWSTTIGASIMTMLQHIPHTWFRLFGKKPDSFGLPSSLLYWYGSLQLLAVLQTRGRRSDTFLTDLVQLKSNKSTKQYFTQMLLAINSR